MDADVVGFFIVEGQEDGSIPQAWRRSTDASISKDALDESLPHRTAEERTLLANGYLGATSWQKVCDTLGVSRNLLIPELSE